MISHPMKKLLFIVLASLVHPAFCQDKPVSTEILTIALDEPVASLYFHNGTDVSTLQANPTGLGEPLKYKGPRRFMLRATASEFSMKPPQPPPLAWVDLPADSERVLLACLKTGETPLKLIAYDIGKARVGAGDYRFFNFSHSVVSTVFGTRKFAVKPGEDTVVSDSSWKQDVSEIDLAMAIVKEGRPKPVYSSQWGNRPGRRNYVFIFNGPREYKPLRICRFFDVPPTDLAKADP